jgi:hypothetical protein
MVAFRGCKPGLGSSVDFVIGVAEVMRKFLILYGRPEPNRLTTERTGRILSSVQNGSGPVQPSRRGVQQPLYRSRVLKLGIYLYADVYNRWNLIPASPIRLYGVVLSFASAGCATFTRRSS